jgi:hypothetical protein
MQAILQNQLRGTATELVRFLNAQLPGIGGDSWWSSHVVNQLTYGQQGQIRTRGIESLGGLDLAALLRVFDRNWAELSHTAKLPNEVRTHAKEVSDLRHSMAHHASEGAEIPITDGYRHLDTIERFLMAIGANQSAIDVVRESKQATLIQMASGMAAPSSAQPEVVQEPAKKEELIQLASEKIVTSHNLALKKEAMPKTPSRNLKGITVGSFQLIGPGESVHTEIASFDGRAVAATAIPWHAIGPNGCDFLIHVVLIDDDSEGEFGQVFCESRLGSPVVWDDIVRRLRVGIRRLSDGQLTMDLRSAVRKGGKPASRYCVPLAEIDRLNGLVTSALLIGLGAHAVGRREELFGETNHTHNWLAVTFPLDDIVTPAAAFVLTTLLSMMHDFKIAPQRKVVAQKRLPINQEARPYITLNWSDLEALAQNRFGDMEYLQKVLSELKYRKSKKALDLYKRLADRLCVLSAEESQSFKWPTTAVIGDSASALRLDHFDYEKGLLKFMGYAVGQKGAYRDRRQQVLDYVFNERIPQVQSNEYMAEWGAPKSVERLKKLTNSLSTFARNARRRRSSDMDLAIAEWEEDLRYLKETYGNR